MSVMLQKEESLGHDLNHTSQGGAASFGVLNTTCSPKGILTYLAKCLIQLKYHLALKSGTPRLNAESQKDLKKARSPENS